MHVSCGAWAESHVRTWVTDEIMSHQLGQRRGELLETPAAEGGSWGSQAVFVAPGWQLHFTPLPSLLWNSSYGPPQTAAFQLHGVCSQCVPPDTLSLRCSSK